MLHEFSLYRSGWSYPVLEWPDNQIFAQRRVQVTMNTSQTHMLDTVFGPTNLGYRLDLYGIMDSPEPGWWSARVSVVSYSGDPLINNMPLSWYTGAPSDWHTGMVRGAEIVGMHPPTHYGGIPERERAMYALAKQYPRSVWTLTVRRAE